jgi:hypothetical protein
MKVWCGDCYIKDELDNFQINKRTNEEDADNEDDIVEASRYKKGTDGVHLMLPFQCDFCLFRTLYKRDPQNITGDLESMAVLRRMNLDLMWSREPSTILGNMRSLGKLIACCESAGFSPDLPALGPLPFKDKFGICIAYGMLVHSRQKGRHSASYTQFETIRKQRSAYSNLYFSSRSGSTEDRMLTSGTAPGSQITICPSSSLWFVRWSTGCEKRMGYILVQNKAISIDVLKAMIKKFELGAKSASARSWDRHEQVMGLVYSIISFCGAMRGSEGLKLDWNTLLENISKGKEGDKTLVGKRTPHIVIPLKGRFKQEKGEKCHLIPLANITKSGIPIRKCVELLVKSRQEIGRLVDLNSDSAFNSRSGDKITFTEMNTIILDCLEAVQEEDKEDNKLGLKGIDIREDYSINRSFKRGSATHAQNQGLSAHQIEVQGRWRKFEMAKGRKPKLAMIEHYSDIELLIPTLVQYSKMM